MAVGYERGNVVRGGRGGGVIWCGLGGEKGWEGEEVAGSRGTVGDEGEYFGDESLLDGCFLGDISKGYSTEKGEERTSCV